MRSVRHWTPRYVLNRSRQWLFERRNPGAPWLTPCAIQLLSSLLRPNHRGLEWGAGRSTSWLACRLQSLVSVEGDRTWYQRVQASLARAGLTNTTLRLESLEPLDNPRESPYVRVVDELVDSGLDLVLVDGNHREWCALAALPKLVPGGLLVLDNANWYVDHPTHSPASRAGLGPLNDRWREFGSRVDGWQLVWTTNGVTDTAIWRHP